MTHWALAHLSPVSVLFGSAAPRRQGSGLGYPEDRAPPTGCLGATLMRCTPALSSIMEPGGRRHEAPKSEVRNFDVVIAPPGRNDPSSKPPLPSRHAAFDLPDRLCHPGASCVRMIPARGGVRWRRIERGIAARAEGPGSFSNSTGSVPVQHRRRDDLLIGIAQKQRKR